MSDLIEEIREQLIAAIDKDQLSLPTMPEIALTVREAAQDPNVSVASLCDAIAKDAAVAARIIKVANSPLFRGNQTIENLRMATTRLGINYTCNLATGLAMKQMFQATTDTIDHLMRQTWSKSTEIGGIAHALARHCSGLQPDQASLAGITHRIGVLPILTFAEDNRKLLSDTDTLQEVIEAIHPDIGTRILTAWEFPEELIRIPSQYLDFDRDAPTADYTDLITVATLQSCQGSDHPLAQQDLHAVKAYARLGLNPDMHEEGDEEMIEHIELSVAAFE